MRPWTPRTIVKPVTMNDSPDRSQASVVRSLASAMFT